MNHIASPQHVAGGGANQRVVVPEGFGTAIPSTPGELMKFLQQQRQKAASSALDVKNIATLNSQIGGAYHSLSEERLKKQEQERENYETRLMQLEDYIFKHEGNERIKRIEERLKM